MARRLKTKGTSADRAGWPGTAPSSDTAHARARVKGAEPAEPPQLSALNVLVPQDPELVAFKGELASARIAGNVSNMEVALMNDLIQLRELQAISTALAQRTEEVRARMGEGLMLTEEKKFGCKIGSAMLSAPPTGVEIFDLNQIPAGYLKVEPDKVKIGKVLRSGATVAGAVLVTKSDKPVLRVTFGAKPAAADDPE